MAVVDAFSGSGPRRCPSDSAGDVRLFALSAAWFSWFSWPAVLAGLVLTFLHALVVALATRAIGAANRTKTSNAQGPPAIVATVLLLSRSGTTLALPGCSHPRADEMSAKVRSIHDRVCIVHRNHGTTTKGNTCGCAPP